MTSKHHHDFEKLIAQADFSVSKVISLHLSDIENAIDKGVSHKAIVQHLREQGICDTSLETFQRTLARLRKRNRESKDQRPTKSTINLPATNTQSKSTGLDSDDSENDATLSKEDLARKYPDKSESELRKIRVAAAYYDNKDELPPELLRLLNKEKQ